jgi:hypothetical protein
LTDCHRKKSCKFIGFWSLIKSGDLAIQMIV